MSRDKQSIRTKKLRIENILPSVSTIEDLRPYIRKCTTPLKRNYSVLFQSILQTYIKPHHTYNTFE